MFDRRLNCKSIGYMLLCPGVLIFSGTIFALFLIPSFGIASGVSFISLIPFFFLMACALFLSGICFYISWRYFKNKPFKQDRTLGLLFLFFGLGYFGYSALICLISNLTGNMGGFGPLLIAFLLMLVLLPLGLVLKNGCK